VWTCGPELKLKLILMYLNNLELIVLFFPLYGFILTRCEVLPTKVFNEVENKTIHFKFMNVYV
jgi:hypothetical protein